jgi:hypothetical protein
MNSIRAVLVVVLLSAGGVIASPVRPTQQAKELVRKAGNTEDEQVRLNYLKDLLASANIEDKVLKKDLYGLVECIERWNSSEHLPYFRPDKEFRVDISTERSAPVPPGEAAGRISTLPASCFASRRRHIPRTG